MYLISIFLGWLVGSIAKIPAGYILDSKDAKKRKPLKLFFDTGGMPSVHSSTVMALTTYTLLADGPWSFNFAVAILFAAIVMTDAINVRRATGENGIVINKILSKLQQKDIQQPHFAKGHKPLEMCIGACLGVSIGVILWAISLNG
jgi:acid phosphatase family membrane protein YuiD